MLKQQLFERSEFCCLIAIVKYNSHAEISLVSINDVKDGVKIAKRIHGNSKSSTKAQHAYDIIDTESNTVVKTGVSGGRIRKDGKSSRAEQQVRKWNREENTTKYESNITNIEPDGEGAREKIYNYEKQRAKQLKNQLDKHKHIRHEIETCIYAN